MRQILEFLGYKLEVTYSKGAFWSTVYLNKNVRIWSNPQTTIEMAIGVGKLNLLKWQVEQNYYPAGITLLSERQLPIIYRNRVLVQLLDELVLSSSCSYAPLFTQLLLKNNSDSLSFLKTPHQENQSVCEFVERLKGSLGKVLEIPELQCHFFIWSIPLSDHCHFPTHQLTLAPDSHKCETYPKSDDVPESRK
jgi:hypothetical protein